MSSSSGLLLLNVEDILGYAQLKAGKFVRDIKRFDIKKAVEDIVAIQQYQAESKEIEIATEFIGFPPKNSEIKVAKGQPYEMNLMIESDEKRIKQVVMNLQSNALKFTRAGGKVTILVEYVRAKGKPQWGGKKSQFFNVLPHSSEEEECSDNDIPKSREINDILKPTEGYDKIVISVVDTGVGIKREDQAKLFKLFGTI